MGTPDHNKRLPLAFASFEPHHGLSPDGSTVRSQDATFDARHFESQTRRDPNATRQTAPQHPHIINLEFPP